MSGLTPLITLAGTLVVGIVTFFALKMKYDEVHTNQGHQNHRQNEELVQTFRERAEQKLNKKEEITCTICYERVSEGAKIILGCGHIFHYECIAQWFKRGKDCPYCRASVN